MVKRRGDKTPEPPGGRAAERLRMFEQLRRYVPEAPTTKKQASEANTKNVSRVAAKDDPQTHKPEVHHAKQTRRKD